MTGLKGSEAVVYYLLRQHSAQTATDLATITAYHPNTIYLALKRLETYQLLERRRQKRGQRYQLLLKDSTQ